MNILLTGGAGYIGSHTFVALDQAGFTPILFDNFSNSHRGVISRLQTITGKEVRLEEGDICERNFVEQALRRHRIDAVIHFAAFKAVGESQQNPLAYYRNNVVGLITLLEAMKAADCRHLVYSSSATVYGNPEILPIPEQAPLGYANTYGHTKLIGEGVLTSLRQSDPAWQIAALRYFNPAGAHESGLIGEDPRGTPGNLMPYIAQVAMGKYPYLRVFGDDYSTSDGTGVRDYIHVMDLAEGHVAALRNLKQKAESFTVNLGTGRGYSVLEIVRAFEKASGRKIRYQIMPRRPGDVASCYADCSMARELLGWTATRGIEAMCADFWRWQSMNPDGFR